MKWNRRNHFSIAILVIVSLAFLRCAQDTGSAGELTTVSMPLQTDDGWLTGNATEAGLDTVRLHNLLRRVAEEEYSGIDAVLIVKEGRLVFEKYFPGNDFEYTAKNFKGKFIRYDRNTIHNLASVTKSVTGILCGIAVDRKLIHGVDESVSESFPELSSMFTGGKEKITLANLLTMSSGLQWNEQDVPYSARSNDIIRLFLVSHPLNFIFSKPLASEPGTKWYYNGGGTNVVGQIIQRKSGTRLDYFADKYLFEPLGIEQSKWVYIDRDFVYCSGDLRLRPRDMAKLGQLVLDMGVWNGRRIVSAEWIARMTTRFVSMPHGEGYGYQWWLVTYKLGPKSFDTYQASGWGGQRIIVIPDLRSVVVIAGSNYTTRDPGNDMMYNYIIPALNGDFRYDLAAIRKAAPLTDTAIAVHAAGSFTGNAGGHWYGEWEGHVQPLQLIVGASDRGGIPVCYSWAPLPEFHINGGSVRTEAILDSSNAFSLTIRDTFRFRYDPVEDVILANMRNEHVTIKAVLRRTN